MKKPLLDPRTGELMNSSTTSTEMIHAALSHAPGSNQRRRCLEAALKMEARPRGRPKGLGTLHFDDANALEIMWAIATRTGIRAAERLARLVVDTGLLVDEKATYWSTVKRL